MKKRKPRNLGTGAANHISFKEARKKVHAMNLINGFIFKSATENQESAKVVVGSIIKRVLNRDIDDVIVTTEKVINGLDTDTHGIRLDALVEPSNKTEDGVIVTIYDVEMEDRPSDRPELPKRRRFYTGLSDSKWLATNTNYNMLPEYISITILSYDPFLMGDMYYEARKQLVTHPEYDYDDGVLDIYLYAYGRPNHPDREYGKKLQKMLKYIVTGEKPQDPDKEIDSIDNIVTAVKENAEVTKEYMRQFDLELSIKRDTRLETRKEDALEMINLGRDYGAPDEEIRKRLKVKLKLNDDTIDELFAQIDSVETPV